MHCPHGQPFWQCCPACHAPGRGLLIPSTIRQLHAGKITATDASGRRYRAEPSRDGKSFRLVEVKPN